MNTPSKPENTLESLFAQARDTEPYLEAGDFVDELMLKLPEKRRLPQWLGFASDAISALLGLSVLAYLLSKLGTPDVAQWLPAELGFNLAGLVAASCVLALFSLIAWWSVEDL